MVMRTEQGGVKQLTKAAPQWPVDGLPSGKGLLAVPVAPKLRIHDLPAVDRPREKMLARGGEYLMNQELLQVILGRGMQGTDVRQLSEAIIEVLERSHGDPKLDDLMAVRGVGKATALKLLASFKLAQRLMSRGARISSPEDAVGFFDDIRRKKQEHFVVITLDGANRVIEKRTVTVGTINASLVHPREVYADAITDRAASIIVAHNHPGGSLEPSQADRDVTRRLQDAGRLLGVQLFDHLIVTAEGYCSVDPA